MREAPRAVRARRHAKAALGREHDLVARLARREPGAEHALGEAVLAVDVGRVDEVDARPRARDRARRELSFSSEPTLCMNDFSSASPKVIAPRQSTETCVPVVPSCRYFMRALYTSLRRAAAIPSPVHGAAMARARGCAVDVADVVAREALRSSPAMTASSSGEGTRC